MNGELLQSFDPKKNILLAEATVSTSGEEDSNIIHGCAIGYNSVGYPYGCWGTGIAVMPGAADKTLKGERDKRRSIMALDSHDSSKVLGKTHLDTLSFELKADGVYYSIDLNPDDPQAMSVKAKVKRGEYDSASLGFIIEEYTIAKRVDDSLDKDEYSHSQEGEAKKVSVIEATEISIVEVSVCAQGAYKHATSQLKSRRFFFDGREFSLKGEPANSEIPELVKEANSGAKESSLTLATAVGQLKERGIN